MIDKAQVDKVQADKVQADKVELVDNSEGLHFVLLKRMGWMIDNFVEEYIDISLDTYFAYA